MKTKTIKTALLLLIISTSLFALEVDIPNEIPAYLNLEINLENSKKEGTIKEARFVFYQVGENEPLYSEFVNENGKWNTSVPYTYLNGEELVYFVIMKNEEDEVFRYPEIGNKSAKLIKDETPPSLKLVEPTSFNLVKGKQKLVVFEIIDESALSNFDIKIDGKSTTKAGAFEQFISILIDPSELDERVIYIEMTDRYGNKSSEKFSFKNNKKKEPFFSYDGNYDSYIELEYLLDMGESENETTFTSVINDLNQEIDLSYGLEGDATIKGGPIKFELSGILSDTISINDITEAYPNTLQADLQNIIQLINPIDFINEYNYSDQVARKYENSNELLARLSILDPFLVYKFGDQEVYYQDETINNFSLRGSTLEINLPILELKVNKGLTNLGLYEESWPQNFVGFKFALKAKDYWHLQTNLSFISSMQGPYDELKSGNDSEIGELYNLDDILPEENMVLGIGTGFNTKNIDFNTTFSLSLYNEDASTILDVNQLATDISNNSSFDLTSYINYLNQIHSMFPILNYFLPSNGLVAGVINKDLWGISYGATFDLPNIGVETWIRKTDSTYKSIGSSIPTDEFTVGGDLENNIGDFTIRSGYSYDRDNLDDILLNELLPIIKPSLAPDNVISENDIANINHTVKLGLDTPQHRILGALSLDYSYLYEKTNSSSLIKNTDDQDTKDEIKNSTDNDSTNTHTGEARWSSNQIELGPLSTSLGATYKNAYVTNTLIDGVDSNTSYNDISYEIRNEINISKYSLSLGYNTSYSTEADSETTYSYDVGLSISDTYFDNLEISTTLDQEYNETLSAFNISNTISLEKEFGILTTSVSLDTNYFDSLLDNNEDALTSNLSIIGTIKK